MHFINNTFLKSISIVKMTIYFLKSRIRLGKVRDFRLKCGINPAPFSENGRIFLKLRESRIPAGVDAGLLTQYEETQLINYLQFMAKAGTPVTPRTAMDTASRLAAHRYIYVWLIVIIIKLLVKNGRDQNINNDIN